MTHGNVAFVTADHDLTSLGHNVHIGVKTRVYGSLASAFAYCFYFGYGIRNLEESSASREKMGKEVGSETEAENGDATFVNYSAKLVYLLGTEELTFVCNYNVSLAPLGAEEIEYRLAFLDSGAVRKKTDARFYNVTAVAVIDSGLNKPHLHSALLVVKFSYESLGGF